ncbi:hypothetical protein CLHUN_40780 [Ruminiclostridium hungatei]|uniref:Uncharacterized protein n=1 Tax=Ruminiclostridium hungatei TaxID=48256 RepID=A0A1V4SDM0_RUMHU|nr:hypothetical protein [Ruminiclostridium hungatei]OPX42019.1 hypothetical protein CLHUN_40780 [Ruminiclostridium hungatei]
MGKPSIGTAQIPAPEKEKKQVIKELTVLKENSKETIYNLIFSEISVEKTGNDKR